MATTVVRTDEEGSAFLHSWTGLANSENGDAMKIPGAADRTVQVGGVFSTGGEVTIQGSNDNTNWVTLTDLSDADLVFDAAAIEVIAEAPLYIRPSITGGDGSTAIDVSILSRGSK